MQLNLTIITVDEIGANIQVNAFADVANVANVGDTTDIGNITHIANISDVSDIANNANSADTPTLYAAACQIFIRLFLFFNRRYDRHGLIELIQIHRFSGAEFFDRWFNRANCTSCMIKQQQRIVWLWQRRHGINIYTGWNGIVRCDS